MPYPVFGLAPPDRTLSAASAHHTAARLLAGWVALTDLLSRPSGEYGRAFKEPFIGVKGTVQSLLAGWLSWGIRLGQP